MHKKPLAIIVSGAPGSGKTTLASQLAHYLNVPHIERDKMSGGLEYTSKQKVDRVNVSIPTYYKHVMAMLSSGISLVTDGTLYKGVSESDLKTHIIAHSVAVNVHASAANEHQRFYEREMQREGRSSDWVEEHMKVLDAIYDQTVNPLDLGIPVIKVDTNDGYRPLLSDIAATIASLYDTARKENA